MKKVILILVILLALLCSFSPSPSIQNGMMEEAKSTFILPDSLLEIGEGAFEGIGANKVVLPRNLLKIGERAFANSCSLREIFIPDTVHDIGNYAFEGSVNLTIIGTVDGYAAQWAKEHDTCFAPSIFSTAWIKILTKLCIKNAFITLALYFAFGGMMWQLRKRSTESWKSMRPQDRPELYPIDYRFP